MYGWSIGNGHHINAGRNWSARFSGDGGPAHQAALNEPAALAIDDRGRQLYIADQSNHCVRMVDLKTGVIQRVAGTGIAAYDGEGKLAIDTTLAGPSGLALVGNRLYIADTFNGRVRCLELSSGLMTTAAGDGELIGMSRRYPLAQPFATDRNCS